MLQPQCGMSPAMHSQLVDKGGGSCQSESKTELGDVRTFEGLAEVIGRRL